MMSPAMQSWMSPLLEPDDDGGPRVWQKGHWIWPDAFNAKADGLGSLATRESETVRRVATAAASSRRAYSEREADMEVFKGLKKMYLLKQGRRVEGMDAMLELVEAERREVLLNRHIIEGKVRAALRGWHICERLHGRNRRRLAAAERRLQAREHGEQF